MQTVERRCCMKFDKEKLKILAALPDGELWNTLTAIGREKGLNIKASQPPADEMAKIRRALCGELGFREALMLINKYKRGE